MEMNTAQLSRKASSLQAFATSKMHEDALLGYLSVLEEV